MAGLAVPSAISGAAGLRRGLARAALALAVLGAGAVPAIGCAAEYSDPGTPGHFLFSPAEARNQAFLETRAKELVGGWRYHWVQELDAELLAAAREDLRAQPLFASAEARFAEPTGAPELRLPWNPPGRGEANGVVLQRRLPGRDQAAFRDPALFIESVDEVFLVRLNGRAIYRFGDPLQEKSHFYGAPWHLIPLPDDYAGGTLQLFIRSNFVNAGVLGTPRLVSRTEWLLHILRQDLGRIICASLFVFMGVLLLGAFATMRTDQLSLTFGLFTILMGFWVFSETRTKQLILQAPLFWRYFGFLSVYLAPAALARFLEGFFGAGPFKIFRIVQGWHIAYAAGSLLLSAAGVITILDTLLPFQALLLLTIGISGAVIIPRVRSGDRNARLFMIGYAFLLVFVLHDVFIALGIAPWGRSMSHWGMLSLAVVLGAMHAMSYQETRRQLARYAAELDVARRIQEAILPAPPRDLPGFRAGFLSIPASAVGGDYYDYVVHDDRRAVFLMADVSGHGLPAALISSMARIAFAVSARTGREPEDVLVGMNQALAGRTGQQFVTAACLSLDLESMQARLANAGHCPAFRERDGKTEEIFLRGRALGWLNESSVGAGEFDLQSGDRIFLYTDGVTEARNPDGELFGEERLRRLLEGELARTPADAVGEALVRRLREWSGASAFEDDVSMIVLEIL